MHTLTNRQLLMVNQKVIGNYPSQLDAQLADRNGWTITGLGPYLLQCTRGGVTVEAHYSPTTNNVTAGTITTTLTGESGRDRNTVRDALTITECHDVRDENSDCDLGPDPLPWVHTSGERAADPHAPGAPQGGYTYSPREGFSDYPDRYISTRHR